MINVSHLTKKFAGTLAIDDISFSVARGEVVGFLGPNGAGKSTTMRILCGFLPPTAGRIEVAGFDVQRQSRQVRSRIGYLPEQCPLYSEMRVIEYLRYRAQLKGVGHGERRNRVNEVMDQCGLEKVQRRIIGQLSKGYRQRVGLADALVHRPELLVLDEPTIGLDPYQIRQVRHLIRNLSENNTILISTHILQEVEMTCDRVLIIKEGRIVAADRLEDLRGRLYEGGRIVLELEAAPEPARARLSGIPGVGGVTVTRQQDAWTTLSLEISKGEDPRPALAAAVSEAGWRLRELHQEQRNLEEVFMDLTQDKVFPANSSHAKGDA